MPKFSLKGKSAIITGGASGIGEAISTTFAAQGAHVHILEFNPSGEQTVNNITEKGGKANFYQCDVSNHQQVLDIINNIAQTTKIDILVNNAGIAHIGNVENTQ